MGALATGHCLVYRTHNAGKPRRREEAAADGETEAFLGEVEVVVTRRLPIVDYCSLTDMCPSSLATPLGLWRRSVGFE